MAGFPHGDTATFTPGRRPASRHRASRRLGRRLAPLVLVLLAVVLLVATPVLWRLMVPHWAARPTLPTAVMAAVEQCHAGDVVLTPEQAGNAAMIAGVAAQLDVPERGAVIAVATALQESSLRNLDHGDQDSLGLFQQRSSYGWGSPDQIRNPAYATRRFLDALLDVPGYDTMPLSQAAQKVQHSAYPDAYASREGDATTIVRVLDQDGVTCRTGTPDLSPLQCGAGGVTREVACRLDRNAVRAALAGTSRS